MQALDRKLIRDFRRLWAQALAIALVLACGVAILQTSFGMSQALEDTRAAYYERNRFADIFVLFHSRKRIPHKKAGETWVALNKTKDEKYDVTASIVCFRLLT